MNRLSGVRRRLPRSGWTWDEIVLMMLGVGRNDYARVWRFAGKQELGYKMRADERIERPQALRQFLALLLCSLVHPTTWGTFRLARTEKPARTTIEPERPRRVPDYFRPPKVEAFMR